MISYTSYKRLGSFNSGPAHKHENERVATLKNNRSDDLIYNPYVYGVVMVNYCCGKIIVFLKRRQMASAPIS